MWHLRACKISVSLSFLKWNDFLLYLWINVANINSEIYDKNHFIFNPSSKNEGRVKIYRLWDATFYYRINTLYEFIKPFNIKKKCLSFRNIEPLTIWISFVWFQHFFQIKQNQSFKFHYENMPIQIKTFTTENWKLSDKKKIWYFFTFLFKT